MIYSRLETLNSRIVKLIATGLILLLSGPVLAATDTVSVKPVAIKKDSTRQTDLMDVFHRLFGLGISNSKNNTVGLKPVATVVPAFGYAMQSRLAVSVS